MTRKKAVILAVCICIFAILLINIKTLLNIPLVVLSKINLPESKFLSVTPIEKEFPLPATANLQYQITSDQFSFIPPWGKMKEEKLDTEIGLCIKLYTFDNKGVAINKNECLVHTIYGEENDLQNAFPEIFQSEFTFYKYLLRLTPKSLNAMMPQQKVILNATLLGVKSGMPEYDQIYEFDKNDLRGFVYFDNQQKDLTYNFAAVSFYEPSNKYVYSMIIRNASEEDISQIVATFKLK